VLKELTLLPAHKLSMEPNVELKIVEPFGKKPKLAWLVVALFRFKEEEEVPAQVDNVCLNTIIAVLLQTTVVKAANLDLVLVAQDPYQLHLFLKEVALVAALVDNVCLNMVIVVLLQTTAVKVADPDLVLVAQDPYLLHLFLKEVALVDAQADNVCLNMVIVVLLQITVVKAASLDLVRMVGPKMLVAKPEDVALEDNVVVNMVIVVLVLRIALDNVLVMNQVPNKLELFHKLPLLL